MRTDKKNVQVIEFIAVGSELLSSSSFLETNSLFLAEKLEQIGLNLTFKTVVSDRWAELQQVIRTARERSQIIFLSGGLGPTEDDRTKEVLARVLRRRLIFKPELLERIKKRFASRGLVMPASNKKQAYLVEGAEKK